MTEPVFLIRRARAEDVAAMAAVMDEAVRSLERPEFFVPDTPEYIARHIEAEGFSLVAEAEDGEVAAFLMVHRPGRSEKHLGRDLGMAEEELDRAVHMDSAAVLPRYRGHGLQRRLIARAEDMVREQGFHTALCTVHPENTASLHTVRGLGYRVVLTTKKYGGLVRHILEKKL